MELTARGRTHWTGTVLHCWLGDRAKLTTLVGIQDGSAVAAAIGCLLACSLLLLLLGDCFCSGGWYCMFCMSVLKLNF